MTAKINLAASRNVTWAPTIDLFYDGGPLPLDGATVSMDIRLYPGAPGEPIVNVSPIPFIDMAPAGERQQRCLRLEPAIPATALSAFPTGLNQPEPGEADAFAFDIIVTYSDDLSDKLALGSFLLEPGVTRL